MAKNAVITVRTSPETKNAAESVFAAFGITLSDAINIFLNKAIMANGIPFDVTLPRYNAETESAMREAKLIASGAVPAKSYTSASELFADLDAENGD
jgi:DNA-damage-inducible protein J